MRNLKRALSLTLASVMLLGMMVVGSSAAGFPDVTEEDNVEAIEVLKAVEVMVGDDNGNFGPNDPVNRSQMAVVMAKLLNLDYQYYESSCIFWDVPTWARGYVGACYAKGIVSGYGGTTYGAADTVTAVQAASMMMRALGYFQYAEDYKGGFELATVSKGTDIGIFKGVGSSATAPMTRNQVAQMALNALQSEMVTFTGTPGVTIGDATVGYRAEYTPRTSTEIKYQAIEKRTSDVSGGNNLNRGQYYIQLGEELYDGKLKLRDDLDAFVRPARHWEYDGKDIGTYVKKELIKQEYVGEVVGKDLYDLLGKSTIEDYDLSVALDGVTDPVIVREVLGYDGSTVLESKHNQDYIFDKADLNRNNKGTVGGTGTGVLTQVFVDDQTEDIYIAVINTYLALADKDYDTKKEELSVKAYSITKNRSEYVKKFKNGEATQIFKLSNEDFNVEGLSKNTPMLLTIADGEVQTAVPAEVLSAVTVSSFKRSSNVVVDGTKYDFTTTAGFKAGPEHLKSYTDEGSTGIVNLKDTVYNVYLDAYGNLIGVEEVDPVKNYVFIAGIEVNASNLTNKNVDASALFLDGTVDTIRVNMGKSDMPSVEANAAANDGYRNSILNTWCTYTVNDSGIYTLTEVIYADDVDAIPGGEHNKTKTAQVHQYMDNSDTDKNFEIDQKHIALKGRDTTDAGEFKVVYGNEDTVYLTAELGKVINGGTWGVIKGVDTRTVGVENANATVWNGANSLTAANQVKPIEKPVANVNNTSKGVYTLYNSDGIIIGAVMVGEDNGAAKNLVYVHSGDVNSESYNGSSSSKAAGDGMWTWTRDVIMNGEEVTLTEVSDSDSALRRMKQYYWYQVKLNGDGEVIDAFKIDETYSGDDSNLEEANLVNLKDFTVDPGRIEETINAGKETVLFFSNERIHDSLSMNGRTLYVVTTTHTGFVVDKNVKYVLQQWNNNKEDTVISEGQGSEGLKSVISEINQRYGTLNGVQNKYDYRVSAILKNGIATSVVIWDDNNDYERPSGNYGLRTMRFDVDEYNLNDFDFILNDKELTRDDFTFTTVDGVRVMELKVRAGDYLSIRSLDETFAPTGSFKVGDTRVTVNSTGTRLSFTVGAESIYFGQIKNIVNDTTEIKGDNKPVDPEKKYYTVTFTGGNFTTTAKEKYEENTKVEITITADEDYELVSVGGVTLDKGATSYKYAIEKITGNVTVEVETKKVVPPEGSVPVKMLTMNGKAQYGIQDVSGNDLEDELNVAKGAKIVLDPMAALTVKTGATMTMENGKEVWTVSADATVLEIEGKAGCVWNGFFWTDADGVVARPNNSASQSLARKYDLPPWVWDVMDGKTATITIKLAEPVGGVSEVVWTVTGDKSGKIVFDYGETTAEQMEAAVGVITDGIQGDDFDVKTETPAAFTLTLKTVDGTAKVYVDNELVEAKEKKTVIDPATEITSTVAVYEIAGGSSVIVNGSGTTLEEGTYVMGKDEVRVKVSKSKSILFEMPAAAFEMDFTQKNDSEATEVRDVTVNHNIKGTWELAGSDKKGELKNGVNTLPEGAKITITDVGDGTVVLKDKKEGTYTKPAEGEAETTVYTKEKGQNEITVGSENIVLYSAVLVSNKTGVAVSGDVALGTEAKTAEPSQKYVAIGAVLTLPNPPADAAYNYIADNSGEDFAWSDKVLERGESGYKVTVTAGKDIVLYKAFKVVVGDGVAAKVGTEAISGTVYVASGETVKASVADTTLRGVKVAKVTDKMVGLESEMTYTDAAISAELELGLAYTLTFDAGINTAAWSIADSSVDSNWTNLLPSKAKEVAAESNQLVFWALEGAWVRADGKTAAPTVSGAVNGSVRTDGKRVTFQIGTEPVSALTKKAEATNGNMSGTLEDLLKTAVDGDTITLNNDVSLTGYNTVTSKITLDLKGYVITVPAKSALSVKGNGNMTITNGKIVAGQGLSHQMTQVLDGATMTLDRVEMSGGLCVFVSGKETGKKCTLNVINRSVLDGTETYEAISTNGLDTKSNHAINIEDSTVKGWEALFLTGVTTTTVTNSTIVGYKNGISIKAGTLNLVGDTSVEGKGSYKVSGTLSTNGSNETGSAIAVFEQAPTYAGNIVINVGANVTLKSNAGPEQDGDKPAILALRNGDHSTENAEKNNTTVTIGGSALTKASNAEDLKKAGVLFYNIAKEDTEDQGDSQGTTQNTAESTVSEEDVDVDENVTENTDAE